MNNIPYYFTPFNPLNQAEYIYIYMQTVFHEVSEAFFIGRDRRSYF